MIADAKDLEFCLRRWGRAFGERPEMSPEELDDLDDKDAEKAARRAKGVLAEAMEHGLRTKRAEAAPMHTNRSHGRLLLMGAGAGLLSRDGKAPRPVPSWAVDPVRAPSSHGGGGSVSHYADPVAEVIERAALKLWDFDRFMAVCLRVEYCTLGKFREKVERAGKHLGVMMPARVYRGNVDKAKVWIAGRLA
jgi:hypothetical protein